MTDAERGSFVSHTPGKRVVDLPAKTEVKEEERKEVADSPLYGVAMLKIAMELKKPDAGALEDIIRGVLSKMNLSEEEFSRYLAQNGGLLKTIAQKKRY